MLGVSLAGGVGLGDVAHPAAVVLDQRSILPVVGNERAGDGGGDSGGRDVSQARA